MANKKVGRPKGSKNKPKPTVNEITVEQLGAKMQKMLDDELAKRDSKNTSVITDILDGIVDSFTFEITENIKNISLDTLQTWFTNPEMYQKEISDLLTYCYIVDGNISALFDMIFSLPELTYTIEVYERTESYEEDMKKIKIALEKDINHKRLTRQLLIQLAHEGTVLGTWLGTKKSYWFEVFHDLEYIYPWSTYKNYGMVGVFDLAYIDTLTSDEKKALYNKMYPVVTVEKYNAWKNFNGDSSKKNKLRYIILDPRKSLCARTGVQSANQRFGIPWGTQAMFDINHKNKMKELERTLSDKLIRAIATLQFDDADSNGKTIKDGAKRKVLAGVKAALTTNKNKDKGITVLGLPSWAKLDTPNLDGDKLLDPDKYESVNNDISNAIGISTVLTNGTGGNYASAKLNLQMIYQKIGALLEEIEIIYDQLICIVLGKSKGNNYHFTYTKGVPIDKEKKLDILKDLSNLGYTIKPVLDIIGVDMQGYIDQSTYEIDKLDLRNKIIPPQSTYQTAGDKITKPNDTTDSNDNTTASKETGGNSTPEANV